MTAAEMKQEFIERWARNDETIEAMEADFDQIIDQVCKEQREKCIESTSEWLPDYRLESLILSAQKPDGL